MEQRRPHLGLQQLNLASEGRLLDAEPLCGASDVAGVGHVVAEEDADGKCVAYLFRAPDGLVVNLEVVRAGFAVTQSGYEFDQKSLFEKYQASAQAAGKGIYGIIRRLRN